MKMKILIGIVFVAFFFSPENGLAQSTAPVPSSKAKSAKPVSDVWTDQNPRAFCERDQHAEVVAYCKDLADLQTAVNKGQSTDNALGKLDLTNKRTADDFIAATATSFAARTAISSALADAGQARRDQQISANASASGATSLVSKTGGAELMALAMDAGALTRSVNGTTATLNTNADQLFRVLTNGDPTCIMTVSTCQDPSWFQKNVLSPTNISAGLTVAQPGSTTTTTSGQASGTTPTQVGEAAIPTNVGKLSSVTVRYQLRSPFDPRSDKFKTAWKAQVTSLKANVTAIGEDTDAVWAALLTHKAFSSSIEGAQGAALKNAATGDSTGKALVVAFERYWQSLLTSEIWQDAKLAAAVSKATQDRTVYSQAWYQALDKAAGNLFTFEYDYNRPANQPITHDFKIIYAYDFGAARGMLTFNGALSLYGTIPAGAQYGNLRDGQVSTEYDRTLSGKDKSLQTQLSLAGYWQYQLHPSILNIPAGTVAPGTTIPLPNGTQEFVGTAGSLWVTQAKLTIKGSGGINIPIGVSWSNKTDLLQGSKVGGQVGISYNFSSLTSLLGGSKSQ
jgi:hypothetical protein